MTTLLLLAALAAGEPPTVIISAQRDAEWAPYRHAYKAAANFARMTRSRPLIQAHMQIQPLQPDLPMQDLQVRLQGEKTDVAIAVDAIGRATVPLLKQAYDEDAVLRLNRQKGHYRFSGRFTIREVAGGVYQAAQLRAACEQLISAQRESNNVLRLLGKKCAGVRFVYPAGADGAAIAWRDASGKTTPIGAAAGPAFDNTAMLNYKVAVYRFADWPLEGEIVAPAPLAIGTLYQ